MDIPAPLNQPGARVFVDTAWRARASKGGLPDLGRAHRCRRHTGREQLCSRLWLVRPEGVEALGDGDHQAAGHRAQDLPRGEASVSFALLDESSGKALGIVTEDSTAHPWMSGAYDWSGPVEVGDADTVEAEAESDRLAALEAR